MASLLSARTAGLSLSARITLAALLLIVAVTAAQVILISTNGRTQYLNEVQDRLTARVDFRGAELQRNIDELRRDTLFLTHTPPVEGILRASSNRGHDPQAPFDRDDLDTWKQRLRELFTAFIEANPDYFQMRYIGVADNGLELVRVDRVNGRAAAVPPQRLQPTPDRNYFQDAPQRRRGAVYLSDIGLQREAGKILRPPVRMMQAMMDIYVPDGRLFGVVVVNMDMGPTLDRLTANLSGGMRAYLMNRDGDYLVHPEPGRVFGFDLGQRYRWQDDMTDRPADRARLSLTVTAPEGPLYVARRVLYPDPQEPRRFMTLVYAMPEAVIDEQVAGTRNFVIAGALGVAVVIGMLFLLYVRRTLNPLAQLTDAAHAIGAGRHDAALPGNAGGELGILAHAFENMQSGIQQREQQVRQLMDVLRQSEERFRLMTASVKDYAIVMLDPQGRVVTWNEGAQRLKGYAEVDVIGQPMACIYLPEDVAAGKPAELLRRAAAEGRCEDEGWRVRKDGTRFYADAILTAMRGDAGELLGFAEITRDITERKRAEQALEEKDSLLATVGAMAKVGGWEFDARTLKGSWTEEVARIHEVDPKDGTDVQIGLDFFQGESREKIEAAVKDAIEQAQPYDLELEMIAAKGTHKWVRTIGQPVLEDGVVVRVRGSFQDITERKRAEDEIRRINVELEERVLQRTADLRRATESMREALTTLDASVDGAFIFDPETLRFSYVNEGAVQQVGYSREELLRMTPVDIAPEYDERRMRELIAPLIRGEQPVLRLRTIYQRKDGSEVPIEVILQYVTGTGERPRFIAIVRDITERNAAEAAVLETAAKLARSNAELEQFAYVASHDLQEPLRMVASYVQLLERRYRDKLDNDAREFIGYAVDGARRMQGLITDLLDYSRVQTRGNPFVPTDLNRVLDATLVDLEMLIRESGAELVREPLPTVVADATQMRQLLQNLVGNALKYRNAAVPHIHIAAERIEEAAVELPEMAPSKGWLLRVADNGIGIEPQYHERIFQLFQRLHTRTEYEGTGLGLALCRRIVERHGGKIWVRSELGAGSTFFAALPDKQEAVEQIIPTQAGT